jgi:thiazole synthase
MVYLSGEITSNKFSSSGFWPIFVRLIATVTISAPLASIARRVIAVELNKEILPFDQYVATSVKAEDTLEVVQAIGGGQEDSFTVAGQQFKSRLLVGTGKYKDMQETRLAIEASGAEIVTVAIRRTNITFILLFLLVFYSSSFLYCKR